MEEKLRDIRDKLDLITIKLNEGEKAFHYRHVLNFQLHALIEWKKEHDLLRTRYELLIKIHKELFNVIEERIIKEEIIEK